MRLDNQIAVTGSTPPLPDRCHNDETQLAVPTNLVRNSWQGTADIVAKNKLYGHLNRDLVEKFILGRHRQQKFKKLVSPLAAGRPPQQTQAAFTTTVSLPQTQSTAATAEAPMQQHEQLVPALQADALVIDLMSSDSEPEH